MKKVIATLATLIVLALLGMLGINLLRNSGPRERVKAENGSKIVVEELSYYRNNGKLFGKVYKPAGEDGFFSGTDYPAVIFFHEQLKTNLPESILKALVPEGMIGYAATSHGKASEAEFLIKKVRSEDFVDDDLVFVIADSASSKAVVEAVSKVGRKVAGLILIEPQLEGKAAGVYDRYKNEFLTIGASSREDALSLIKDYLESRGALK
jgi:hypothetical protein